MNDDHENKLLARSSQAIARSIAHEEARRVVVGLAMLAYAAVVAYCGVQLFNAPSCPAAPESDEE